MALTWFYITFFICITTQPARAQPEHNTLLYSASSISITDWIGSAGLLLIVLYYVGVWLTQRTAPRTDPIQPRYAPPDGVGPAACRYILTAVWDPKGFAAALMNLAGKGFVRISEFETDCFKIIRTGASPEQARLSPAETAVALTLFGRKLWTSFVFRSENHALSKRAHHILKRSLKEDFETVYFANNKTVLSIATAISAMALGAMVTTSPMGVGMGLFALSLSLLGFALYPLLLGIWTGWRQGEGAVISGSLAVAIALTVAGLALGEDSGPLLSWLKTAPLRHIFLIALIIGANLLGYHMLKSPSCLGRKVRDNIEGFRLYLSADAQDQEIMESAPDLTVEVFEEYLPYAIALDVEAEWVTQFERTQNRVGEEKHAENYHPTWFNSPTRSWPSPCDFAKNFTPLLAESILSSFPPHATPKDESGVGDVLWQESKHD